MFFRVADSYSVSMMVTGSGCAERSIKTPSVRQDKKTINAVAVQMSAQLGTMYVFSH